MRFLDIILIIFLIGLLQGKHKKLKSKQIEKKYKCSKNKHKHSDKKLINEQSETKSTILVPIATAPISTVDDEINPSVINPNIPVLTFESNNGKLPTQELLNVKPVRLEDIYKDLSSREEKSESFGDDKEDENDDKEEIITEDNGDDDDDEEMNDQKLELYKNLLYNKELLANALIRKYYNDLISQTPSIYPIRQTSPDLGIEQKTMIKTVENLPPITKKRQSDSQVQKNQRIQEENYRNSINQILKPIKIDKPVTTILNTMPPSNNIGHEMFGLPHDTKSTQPINGKQERAPFTQEPPRMASQISQPIQESPIKDSADEGQDSISFTDDNKNSNVENMNPREKLPAKLSSRLLLPENIQSPYIDNTGLHLNYEYDGNDFKINDVVHSAYKAKNLYEKIQSMDENLLNYLSNKEKAMAKYLDKNNKHNKAEKHGSHKRHRSNGKSKRIKLFSYLIDRIRNMTEDSKEEVYKKLSQIIKENEKAKLKSEKKMKSKDQMKNGFVNSIGNTTSRNDFNKTSIKPEGNDVLLEKTMRKIDMLMGVLLSSDGDKFKKLNARNSTPFSKYNKSLENITFVNPNKSIPLKVSHTVAKHLFNNTVPCSRRYSCKTNTTLNNRNPLIYERSKNLTKVNTSKKNISLLRGGEVKQLNSLPANKIVSAKIFNLPTNKVSKEIARNNSGNDNSTAKLKARKNEKYASLKHFRNVIIETDDTENKCSFAGKNVYIRRNNSLTNIDCARKKVIQSNNFSVNSNRSLLSHDVNNFKNTSTLIPYKNNSTNTTFQSNSSRTSLDDNQITDLRKKISKKLQTILKSIEMNMRPKNSSTHAIPPFMSNKTVNETTVISNIANLTEHNLLKSKQRFMNDTRRNVLAEASDFQQNKTNNELKTNLTTSNLKENRTKTFFETKDEFLINNSRDDGSVARQNINETWKEEVAMQLQNFFKTIFTNTKKKVLIPRKPIQEHDVSQITEKKIHIAKPFVQNDSSAQSQSIIASSANPYQQIAQTKENYEKRLNGTLSKIFPLIPIPVLRSPISKTTKREENLINEKNVDSNIALRNATSSSTATYPMVLNVTTNYETYSRNRNSSVLTFSNKSETNIKAFKRNKKADKWVVQITD